MASLSEQPTPHIEELPGAWIETPAQPSRQHSYLDTSTQLGASNQSQILNHTDDRSTYLDYTSLARNRSTGTNAVVPRGSGQYSTSSMSTAVPSPPEEKERPLKEGLAIGGSDDRRSSVETEDDDDHRFAAIKPGSAAGPRPSIPRGESKPITEDDLFRVLSKRRSNNLHHANTAATSSSTEDEQEEINKLMSRMFGKSRQESSEEEQTRHFGVVFKHLTVKGMGLGAALQPSVGDVLLGFPRFLKNLITKGPRKAAGKPPVRTILNDFSGCIRPGEMLLVLGRPGAGCSTFLKILGNQRFGYEKILGDVTYGGTDAKEMEKKFRSEVLYNPEDDLHYATLKVKETLKFALKTRTPGKNSRKEGESRSDYVNEFLRVVAKLFWIEHTMGTKVGNEFVRGVSGGEKKRVSIAEALITKASIQSWDNSTRGLDASTALEYVESLRSLTNMARISTSVALYQAGESLYNLFDKVLLIHEGHCCYFGPAEQAVEYCKHKLVLLRLPACYYSIHHANQIYTFS